MRLFIAVPIPEPALSEAGAILSELRGLDWPVRWVGDGALHLTLKFFGEVTTDRLDAIEEMVAFATEGLKPMAMSLASGGGFPTRRHPRVLRLEVSAGPDLELLQDRLERGGEQIGFPPEGRPFRPHLTLGRVREGHRLPPRAMDRLEGIPPGASFHADRVILYESRLGKGAPAYTPRLEKLLAP